MVGAVRVEVDVEGVVRVEVGVEETLPETGRFGRM